MDDQVAYPGGGAANTLDWEYRGKEAYKNGLAVFVYH